MSAVRTLAAGWRRGSIRWYIGTSAVLAVTITLLLVVAGLFSGMQVETRDRVSDFYTEDVRVTVAGGGAIPPGTFDDPGAAVRALTAHGGQALLHLEAQGVLSRRGFVEAALTEDESFQLDAPGSEASGDELIALGALIGIDMGVDRARAPVERHLVAGSLPRESDGEGSVPLALSLDRFEDFLTPEERAGLDWPPSIGAVQGFSFEITSAVVKDQGQDVIRRPAHVVALYDSGVDVLDAFTFVAPIEDVRALLGHAPDDDVVNAILVATDDAGPVHAAAGGNRWSHQSAARFTDRYLGQLVDVLQGMSLLMSGFLFLLPAFLVTHGVTRQLETHNREIAVCKAIGVRGRTIRTALSWLVVQVTLTALAAAALFTLVAGLVLHAVLPGRRDLPLPMDFSPTAAAVLLALSVTLGSVVLALWIAFRIHAKQPLAGTLRTF